MSVRVASEDLNSDVPTSAWEFEDFFAAEWTRLFQTMFLACGSASLAEDLAQESMARTFERWDRVRRMDHPAGYVYRVAFNLHRRWMGRLRRAPAPEFAGGAPEDPADVASTRARVLEVLRALPSSQREAILLVEWAGMTADEAASVLGVASASVRGRLHRARLTVDRLFGGSDA